VAGSTTGSPGPEPKGFIIAISAGIGCETRVGSLYSAGACGLSATGVMIDVVGFTDPGCPYVGIGPAFGFTVRGPKAVESATTGSPGPEPTGLMIAISAGVGCETRVGSLYSAGACGLSATGVMIDVVGFTDPGCPYVGIGPAFGFTVRGPKAVESATTGWPGPEPTGFVIAISAGVG
jgi:hypothetical protein